MDKILLVTGGSSEVGMQLVREIYDDYALIYMHYHTMNKELEKTVNTIDTKEKIKLLQADFSNEKSVKAMINHIMVSGILPNQIIHIPAPKAYNKQFHKDKWDNYELGWEISVHSIILIIQAFIKNMARGSYGRIVFMLSSVTDKTPPKYQTSYVTVKYALLGLMRALSAEYAEKGITCNGVSPDMMDTKFLSELPTLLIEQYRSESPIGRNILCEEVTSVIRFLLSDLGAGMTGQNIVISGGR